MRTSRKEEGLVEQDNKQQDQFEEVDRFSNLMFGNRRYRMNYKEDENISLDLTDQQERATTEDRTERIDNWLFGLRNKKDMASTLMTQRQYENSPGNVDINLLIETIEMFVETTKQFQPFLKEVSPLLHKFSKKFKFKQ